MKNTLILIVMVLFAFEVLLASCEKGQQRVDNWERETGKYGQGLR